MVHSGMVDGVSGRVSIKVPTPLKGYVDGQGSVEVGGSDVGEALFRLVDLYPGARERLFNEAGEFHRFVNVYVNGEDIRFTGGLRTALKAGDEVSIVPAVAGGYV